MTKESSPAVALCVPAYNAVRTLPRLFASVRAQSVPFDEVWVYDDASSDDTAALATTLGARVLRGEQNIGCSGGKNALLARVESEWVHFHDVDDVLHPRFVERAKARIAGGGFDVLLFDYEQCDEATGSIMSRSCFGATTLLQDPLDFMLMHTVNNGGVYSTDMLRTTGGFDTDPAVRFNEDRAFHLRLAEQGARFAYEPYVGSRFFFSSGSMSASNRAKCSIAHQEITRRFASRHPGKYRSALAELAWHNAGNLATYLAWPDADICVDFAVRMNGRLPHTGGKLFKLLCLVDGKLAIRVRERLIRRLKPQLRSASTNAHAVASHE